VSVAQRIDDAPAGDRFLHLTDLHFWSVVFNPLQLLNKRLIGNLNVALRRRHELITAQSTSFLDHLAGLGVRDVILTGDFSSTATDTEFRAARAFVESLVRAGMRPTVIPGNHDVYTFESAHARRFEQYLSEWMPAPSLPAEATLPGGTPVVYVPTVCPNHLSSRGRITDVEIQALRDLLKRHKRPLIVAGHYPILDRTYGYAMNPNRRLRGAAALRDALGGYAGRLLYISGHVHRFSHVLDPVFPFVAYLTTGALFRRDSQQGHTGEFSEVRAGQGGFRVLRHRFAAAWSVTEHPPQSASPNDCPSA
jgi:3',5'-cyclic AMP phosphodiesterase CpdA